MRKPTRCWGWRLMSAGLAAPLSLALLASCFSEKEKKKIDDKPAAPPPTTSTFDGGAVGAVAARRGLSDADLLAAAETFVPTGARDEYVGLMGTGTGGKAVIFAMPSMRILKYVAVFSLEPWQGYAFDDESRALLAGGARGEIEAEFGDMGLPALSMKGGNPDGHHAFFADAANGRVARLDLADYETKQVIANPHFRTSDPSMTATADGDYAVTAAAAPEALAGAEGDAKGQRGGLTFWRFRAGVAAGGEGETEKIERSGSFSVELPPHLHAAPVAGRGASADWVFVIGTCANGDLKAGAEQDQCGLPSTPAVLAAVNWKTAADLAAKAAAVNGMPLVRLAEIAGAGGLRQVALPPGSEMLAVSPDGATLAVSGRHEKALRLYQSATVTAATGAADEFGVPTATANEPGIELGAPVSAMAFGAGNTLLATTVAPGKLVRLDLAKRAVAGEAPLDFDAVGLMLPLGADGAPSAQHAVVINPTPHGRFVSVGPQQGLNPQLFDISGATPRFLYNMSVPQASGLAAVAYAAKTGQQMRYKGGTNSRTGEQSPFRTIAGQERVVRDGKHVHVFATLIRSHMTPETIEVDEGDTVSVHLTNLEQAQDQTHGFTIDTYNVHGSWEPGKTASVTFVANRPGVFPMYCTEFCSALHLEMQGYLLVKPKGWKPGPDDQAVAGGGDAAAEKQAYDDTEKKIKDTQAVIDSVVAWLKENKYETDERAAALVTDAVAQLEQTKPIRAKIDAAVAAQDWPNARLWAEQYFQYQVKAADAGLRAKKVLSEKGGK